ncbi:hypothetical protein SmJEL517_g01971 [Synchytrium microbalum]|uniref:Aminotransferase class I/classII large domain-containing protein n=1 Tax=Synchytrium microbalum TaxID=1806994 RepID=A0A507C982_9FUNG|nr:uncharacterized protein SmJEL517_g01971 [Synchytrium microbalum]TPX35729.1 hypothetical protein SmJEL517_g01971 [Synchytrium microbalum]
MNPMNSNGMLPKAKDFTSFLSKESSGRERSGLKSYIQYTRRDGMRSLGGGLPHPSLFSFASVDVAVTDYTPPAPVNGAKLSKAAESNSKQLPLPLSSGPSQKPKPTKNIHIPLFPDLKASITLAESLQYGQGQGSQKLINILHDTVQHTHKPKYSDFNIIVTAGNTDAMDKSLRLLCERGDAVLVEEWSYPSAMEQMRPMGVQLVPVKVDSEGMVPEDLIRATNEYRMANSELRLNIVYCVPTGQNPLGTNMSIERRQAFYNACQQLDLIILEDDPYSVLQLPPFTEEDADKDLEALESTYSYPGTTGLMPSLFSMDTDGRVIYMYTYSKVLAPGCRLGYVVLNAGFYERFTWLTEVTTQGASGFSQSIVTEMLSKWTPNDHYNLAINLQKHYTHKRNIIVKAAMKALHKSVTQPQLASFVVPTSGMFLWIKVNLPESYKAGIMKRIFDSLIQQNVLLVPGMEFSPFGKKGNEDAPYFRAAFCFATDEALEQAMITLGKVLKDFGCGQS